MRKFFCLILFGFLSCGKEDGEDLDRSVGIDEVIIVYDRCLEDFSISWKVNFNDVAPQKNGIVLVDLTTGREPTLQDIDMPATVLGASNKQYSFKISSDTIDKSMRHRVRAYTIVDEEVTYGPTLTADWVLDESSETNITIEKLRDFPGTPVGEAVAFSANGKGYLCCGINKENDEISNDFWRYDPIEDSWEQLPDFPGPPGAFHTSFVTRDYAYIAFGGASSNGSQPGENQVFKYHLMDQTWTELEVPDFGGPQAGVSFIIDSTVYFTNFSGNQQDLFLQLDLRNETWLQSAKPSAIASFSARNMAVVANGTGYFIDAENSGTTKLRSFNPSSNTWPLAFTFNSEANDGLAFVVNDKIYILTGRGLENNILEFDPALSSGFYICSDPTFTNQIQRSEAVGFVFDNEIIITNGVEYNLDPNIHANALSSVYKITID